MTATERDALLHMAIGCDVIDHIRPKLERRMKTIPRAASRLGIARWAMDSLIEDVMKTMPTDQLVNLRNNLNMRSYIIGVKSPANRGRDMNYGLWISFEQMNELMAACHDHCLTCGLDLGEQRRCRLRKALDAMGNDVPDRPDGGCPYYGVM